MGGHVLALDALLPRTRYHVTVEVTDEAGALHNGNDLLNRLYENVIWGQRSNFLSVPTDCPQRDERLGWTGDAQAILLQEAPALFGVLKENNLEFTTQTLRELSAAFFLGLNPQKIEALVARLSEIKQ